MTCAICTNETAHTLYAPCRTRVDTRKEFAMRCVMCGGTDITPHLQLCMPCQMRLAPIWKEHPIASYCPRCGLAPLAEHGFRAVFPNEAARRGSDELILIIYDGQGCHRCAETLAAATANIWRLRPKK